MRNNGTAELWNHFLVVRITIKCYVNDKHIILNSYNYLFKAKTFTPVSTQTC